MCEIGQCDRRVIDELGDTLWVNSPCLRGAEAVSNPRPCPIDIVAIIVQFALVDAITKLDKLDDITGILLSDIREQRAAQIWKSSEWQGIWRRRIRIETTIRKLSIALSSEQWSKGHAPLATELLQEYVIVLHRLRFYGEVIGESVQQSNALTSIEETRRGMQQSDSVRRYVKFCGPPLGSKHGFLNSQAN